MAVTADATLGAAARHEHLLAREWLLTNGLGGYAMGTLLGPATRRYHGLLVAALDPPTGRFLALHSLVEQIVTRGAEHFLTTQQFGEGAELHPDGWKRLREATVDETRDAVTWCLAVPGGAITRTVTVIPGRNAVDVTWHVAGPASSSMLRIRPLTPMRDFHELSEQSAEPPRAALTAEGIEVRSGDVTLRMTIDAGGAESRWRIEPQWWGNLCYTGDRDRRQAWREDVWSAGVAEARFPGSDGGVRLRAEIVDPEIACPVEAPPRPARITVPVMATARERLEHAAAAFIVRRCPRVGGAPWGTSIIAGYPWFADWGRDAMISLPGLLLATGRLDEAIDVLTTFAGGMRNGLVPNCFHDRHDARYNTADASLWFIQAVHACRAAGATVRAPLIGPCREIVAAYIAGTDFGIRVGDDGLVSAGDGSAAVTWMDAHRDGVMFTPRTGKPVEINALWHHALLALAEMSPDEAESDELRRRAERTRESFRMAFWWPERRCLHDVIDAKTGRGDGRLRPNQILAVSLPHSPLLLEDQAAVVEAVREHLLTPVGLRTLAPSDPGYRGRYEGSLFERDAAYHNGTVWPWLIGPYCEALLRLGRFSPESRERAHRALEPLIDEIDHGCIGQIAEVYDGDAPHRPSGCPAQAWSVAEVLRVLALLR